MGTTLLNICTAVKKRRGIARVLLIMALLVIGQGSAATPCLDYARFPNVRDKLTGDGPVLVAGMYAYTGHLSRLFVYDLSTSPHATQVADVDLGVGSFQDMAKVGDALYVATSSGMALANVTDPTRPIALPSPIPGVLGHVVVDGERLYVESRRDTPPFYHFRVFDVSSPQIPVPLGQTTLPFAGAGFAIANEHAYVAMTNGGVQVIDISNPIAPMKRGSFHTLGMHARDVAVRGGFGYVTSSEGGFGLYVLNVSDPEQPLFVAGLSFHDGGWGIGLAGDTAYVAGGAANGVAVVDISEPTLPRFVETVDVRSFSTAVEVTDDAVFVGAHNGIFQITSPAAGAPPIVGAIATPGEASFVARAGNLALVMDGEAGVQVIDVAEPAAPAIVGSIDTPGYASRAAVSGSHAFLALGERGPGGLVVVDFSVPSSPQVIADLDTGEPAIDVVVEGDYACVAATSQMHVVDVSTPDAPVILGSATMRQRAIGVALHGAYAYVAERESGVTIVDISNPNMPRVVGAILDADNAVRVQVVDGRLYVASFASLGPDLVILDLADPLAPTRLGSVELRTSSFLHFAVDGNLLYTSDGIHVIDISDPHNPHPLAGAVHVPDDPTAVAVDAEHLFLATGTGLEIRAKQCDVSTSVVVAGFEAVLEAGGVRLRWTTPDASFRDFDVLRQERNGGPPHPTAAYEPLPRSARDAGSGTFWEFIDTDVIAGRIYRYKIRGHRADGRVQVHGPVEASPRGATRFALHSIRPNPAAGAAFVHFELPHREPVELDVFDVAGRRVRRLFQGSAGPGFHVLRWDGQDSDGRPAPSGVYFVRYRGTAGLVTRRLTLMR